MRDRVPLFGIERIEVQQGKGHPQIMNPLGRLVDARLDFLYKTREDVCDIAFDASVIIIKIGGFSVGGF